MTKIEFEELTLRSGEHIGTYLYERIERYYMSDNDYHYYHGGIDENKRDFCKRVFGGKVNTPKTILAKIIAESQKENRWALRYNEAATKDRLDNMDTLIAEHITAIAKWN